MRPDGTVVTNLITEKKKLERIIAETESDLSHAPDGCVRIAPHGKGVQYYHRKTPEDRWGSYIPTKERKLAQALVQKRYNQQIVRVARKQLEAINRFLDVYEPKALENVYRNSGKYRQDMITPVMIPDEEYADRWQSVAYPHKGFAENTPEHYTVKGERVRSKSEAMIANALNDAGIPYRYEYPLKLDNTVIYPDFTVLKIPDRKEMIWEHLGIMDNPEYRNNAFWRIRQYESRGIIPGDRLILTFETNKYPLNLPIIDQVIKNRLKEI